MHQKSRRVTSSSSRPYYVLIIERLEVDMKKMVNLLEFGCLGSCWEISSQSKGVNCITSGYALWFFIYVNRGQMQTVRSEDVLKQVIHTIEGLKQNIKEMTEEFLRSLDLLFDIAHDQATSWTSHNNYSCQMKSMIAQDLTFLEDQRSGRKLELGNMDKEYCLKVIRKACRRREELYKEMKESIVDWLRHKP